MLKIAYYIILVDVYTNISEYHNLFDHLLSPKLSSMSHCCYYNSLGYSHFAY